MNCPVCRNEIQQNDRKCKKCGLPLTGEIFEIAAVRSELGKLHLHFSKQIEEMSEKIDAFERKAVRNAFALPEDVLKTPEETEKTSENHAAETVHEESTQAGEEKQKASQDTDKENQKDKKEKTAEQAPKFERKRTEFEKAVELFFTGLFLPLLQFREFFMQAYNGYKAQNKLPVFFLTIGGIVALLMGFGFLLNFVSDTFFEIAKIGMTGISAFGFAVWGMRLSKKEKLREFGSAMIALGISVNYLLIYFLSNSTVLPFFDAEWFGLLLITLNTAFAYFLALRYDTKVVLVLSLIGGAMSPFFLSSSRISLFYFVFLWILTVSTILIAEKAAWRWVIYLCFVLTASIFEGSVFSWNATTITEYVWVGISALFAFTYYYTIFFGSSGRRSEFSPQDLLMTAANTTFYIINLNRNFNTQGSNFVLGAIFLLSGLPFALYFVFSRSEYQPKLHSLLVLLAATLAAFSVPVLFDLRINGVIWGIEALLLTVLGFVFGYVNIRKEAYVLFAVAVVANVLTFGEIGTFWGQRLYSEGLLNLTGLCINLFALYGIMRRNSLESESFEKVIRDTALAGGFWTLSALLWVTGFHFFGVLYYNFVLLFVFGFLFLSSKTANRGIAALGYFQLVFLLWSYYVSADAAQDMAFRFQTQYAQAALAETYFSLWLIYFFYEKVVPDAPLKSFAYFLRVVFYVLAPFIILPSVFRFHEEYFPAAMWSAVGIAYLVYHFTGNKLIYWQLHFTAVAALGVFLEPTGIRTENGFLFANAISAVVCVLVWLGEKAFLPVENDEIGSSKPVGLRVLLLAAVYQFALVLFFGGMRFISELPDVFWLSGLFLLLAAVFGEKTRGLQGQFMTLWRSLQVLQSVGLLAYVTFAYFKPEGTGGWQMYFNFAGIAVLMLLNFMTLYKSEENHALRRTFPFNLWILHLQLLFAYWGIIAHIGDRLTGLMMTIVMVFHAIVLIFNGTNRGYESLTKLSVLIFVVSLLKLFFRDLANYGAVEKIIVMMVVGVLMLIGSFVYAKYKGKKSE